jgi:hypothetical protein
MKHPNVRSLCTPMALALATTASVLIACGGGGNDEVVEPPEFPTSEDSTASRALERFAASIDSGSIEQTVAKGPGCDPEVDCAAVTDETDTVVGKDLAMAITDPSTDVPGGAAFIEQPNPQGPVPELPEPKIPEDLFNVPGVPVAPAGATPGRMSAQAVTDGPDVIANPANSGKRAQRVKLLVRFKSQPGKVTPCSGTLIGSDWVLTAGHCVFLPTIGPKNEYPESVEVIPAYGNKDPYYGLQPWGSARLFAKKVLTRKGWWEEGDNNFDMAWMQLSQPIGGFVGYHKIKNLTCDEAVNTDFVTSAYPAKDNPPDPYPTSFGITIDGQTMVETKYQFSKCHTGNLNNRYRVNGFESKGGESGSGAVLPGTGGGFGGIVTGVLSTGTAFKHGSQAHTDFVRLGTNGRDKINASMQEATPNGVDLTAAYVRLSTETVSPGKVPTFNTTQTVYAVPWIHNLGKSKFSGTLSYTIYLSTNNSISSLDTPLGGTKKVPNFELNSKETQAQAVQVKMPSCRPKGKGPSDLLYAGVIVNNSDANNFNNDSSGFSFAFKLSGPQCSS